METFVNKVAESGILTLNLEDFYPKDDVMVFDMKDHLFMGLILKEKDFRETLKAFDVTPYSGKFAAVYCSTDAIIPVWAYMLAASALQPVAKDVIFGSPETVVQQLLINSINELNEENYEGHRVVVKGCGELPITEAAYIAITKKLRPVAKSIMYGEPCSTVPIFKRK